MKVDHDSLKLDWSSWLPVVAKSDYVKVEGEGHKLDYYMTLWSYSHYHEGEARQSFARVIITREEHDSL